MIRKYHNHKLQTNPWHREEEPHNNQSWPRNLQQLRLSVITQREHTIKHVCVNMLSIKNGQFSMNTIAVLGVDVKIDKRLNGPKTLKRDIISWFQRRLLVIMRLGANEPQGVANMYPRGMVGRFT